MKPGLALGVVTTLERDGKAVGLGIGPERVPIAVASRLGLLVPLLRLYEMSKRVLRGQA